MKIPFWRFSSGFLLNNQIFQHNCIILDVVSA